MKFHLVDHENTGKVDFSSIADDTTVLLFFGAAQNNVPKNYLDAARKLGERLRTIDIAGQGKNALDFHIAFYLGEILTRTPDATCVIVSNDKGFDPLIEYLCGRGSIVSRLETTKDKTGVKRVIPTPHKFNSEVLTPHAKEAYQFLLATQKVKRPRKQKSLTNHLLSHFRNKLTEVQTKELVAELIGKSAISENNHNLTYHF